MNEKNIIRLILIIITIMAFFSVNNIKAQTNGWKIEGENIYYLENGQKVKGFKEIEGKTYFFSNLNSALKSGLQGINNKLFYLNEDGSVYQGWKEIEDKIYYFGQDYYAVQGFQTIEEKTYFFSYINSAIKYGWQRLYEKDFYLN